MVNMIIKIAIHTDIHQCFPTVELSYRIYHHVTADEPQSGCYI